MLWESEWASFRSLKSNRVHRIHRIVAGNITTALVLEDDADWDIRIKSQMRTFATASQLLLQPSVANELGKQRDIDVETATTSNFGRSSSSYGEPNNWDVLWLGHCGGRFPRPSDENPQLARVIVSNDETVPEPQHLDGAGDAKLKKDYPAHTRVVSRARRNACTLAYGVSQSGARRILYELGLRKMDRATDIAFQDVCDGTNERRQATCLAVSPPLFNHHRPIAAKASFSDIQDHGEGYNEVAYTKNVRWSTRVNFPKLVNGETDYIDLFKDGEPKHDFDTE
jgi:hypothetical protein